MFIKKITTKERKKNKEIPKETKNVKRWKNNCQQHLDEWYDQTDLDFEEDTIHRREKRDGTNKHDDFKTYRLSMIAVYII